MRFALAAIALAIAVGPGWANMPTLLPLPRPATLKACQAWAGKQSEDSVYMWGMQEDGETSESVARSRLTSYCMGGSQPEIVGFGSSAGFDDAYCRRHPGTGICVKAQGH